MAEKQKTDIVASILEEVERAYSARVGYHAKAIMKEDVPYSYISKIEKKIKRDKRYDSRSHPTFAADYEIFHNEEYKKPKWIEDNPIKWELIKLGISFMSGVGATSVGILLKNYIDKH